MGIRRCQLETGEVGHICITKVWTFCSWELYISERGELEHWTPACFRRTIWQEWLFSLNSSGHSCSVFQVMYFTNWNWLFEIITIFNRYAMKCLQYFRMQGPVQCDSDSSSESCSCGTNHQTGLQKQQPHLRQLPLLVSSENWRSSQTFNIYHKHTLWFNSKSICWWRIQF